MDFENNCATDLVQDAIKSLLGAAMIFEKLERDSHDVSKVKRASPKANAMIHQKTACLRAIFELNQFHK